MTSSLRAAQRHCVELVRRADYESHLCALLLPSAASRDAAFAVRALNVETAIVKSVVSKPELGLIRLAWWQQQVDDIYAARAATRKSRNSDGGNSSNSSHSGHNGGGGNGDASAASPANPVVHALAHAISQSSLTKGWLTRFLDARMAQIEAPQPASVAAVEHAAEHIHSSLLYLLLESVGVKHVDADHVASHIGIAAGIVTSLRALPFTAAAGDVPLPHDLMAKHSLSTEALVRSLAGAPRAADAELHRRLSDCVYDLAVVAKQHLDLARALHADHPPPPAAAAAFFCAVPLALYLERLERANFNCLAPELHQRPFALYARLAGCRWLGHAPFPKKTRIA